MSARREWLCLVLGLVLAAAWAGPLFGAEPAATPAAGTTVSIVKGADVEKMVAEALDLIGGLGPILKDGDTVVIKPNLVTPDKAERPGLMTDVRVVGALVRQIQKVARCRIIIAEGSASDWNQDRRTRLAFEQNGYADLAKQCGAELKDLNEDQRITVRPAGLGYPEYEMPETIMKCNVLIDVPVPKTHLLTGVTLGMKNLFGLMPLPKAQFHEKIHEVLCDIVRMRKPDLTVVDALVCTEGQGPLWGTPVRMDLILAGRDVVAVDAVMTAVMGYEPRRIRHLALAAKSGLGEIDLNRIAVRGRPIAEVKRPFACATWDAQIVLPKTDALAKKVLALADGVEPIEHRHGVVGKEARFKAERLRSDTAKYPLRKSYGFTVGIYDERDGLVFRAPYETLFEENCQAAIEEMYRWIEENLGVKQKGAAGPKGVYEN